MAGEPGVDEARRRVGEQTEPPQRTLALEAGREVVCDRYAHSSLAYQGYGRGLPLDELRRLSAWATGDLWPDVVVLLEVPDEVARGRMGAPDRFEAEDRAFHDRVRHGYRQLADSDRHTWRMVDGSGTPEEVAARVRAAVGTG